MISNSQDELQSRYEENVCAHGIYAKDYCGLCNGPTSLLGQDEPELPLLPKKGRGEDWAKYWGRAFDERTKQLTQALTSLAAAQDKLDRMPADWFENSSLELWFPFTAAELRAAQEQIEQLEASLAEAQKRIEVLEKELGR